MSQKARWYIYADLDGFRASSNPPAPIPPEMCLIPYRPDIVVTGRGKATLLELTLWGLSSCNGTSSFKERRKRGLSCHLITTASHRAENHIPLGHSNAATLHVLKEVCQTSDTSPAISQTIKQFMTHCARIAISCSQIIFYARKNNSWESRPLFKLHHQ